MSAPLPAVRSLYRRFLRELPARSPSLLANPSPIQRHLRQDFTAALHDTSTSLSHQAGKPVAARLHEAEQYLLYVKSQRVYATLLERYNPGMNMGEEDRVRLSARRVGINLPEEYVDESK
ncbi:hypothetical protein B0A48_15722 [Cryoendolithus antarcticus]|uniref:ATP synthase assembly factor FMC1, mitochondrial n=1 Tax=Cryoendolithus antarcticus TaxID=1507870 RepID=A0A1V8SH22_9PEZI|nr:hypothetical protein B0A48_15722 [Cryoendolithus antarcticus]